MTLATTTKRMDISVIWQLYVRSIEALIAPFNGAAGRDGPGPGDGAVLPDPEVSDESDGDGGFDVQKELRELRHVEATRNASAKVLEPPPEVLDSGGASSSAAGSAGA